MSAPAGKLPVRMQTLATLMAALVLLTSALLAHAVVVGESAAPVVAASR